MNPTSASVSSTIRAMVRERAEQLLRQWHHALERPWEPELMGVILNGLGQLGEGATRFGLEQLTASTRDASSYLASMLDGGIAPNAAQLEHLGTYLEQLRSVVHSLADGPAGNVEARSSVLYVRPEMHSIPGLDAALRSRGLNLLTAEAPDGIAAAVHKQALVGVLVDASCLSDLGEIIDSLDQHRQPGATPPLLVLSRERSISQQLLGMTGSADAFVASADAASVARKLEDLQRSLRSAEPLRVLIVDDDRSQVLFCESVLRRRGLLTETATSSNAALNLVQRFRPDLMLVDLYMPEIDGMALTARVREMPDMLLLPIIFMSGEQDVGRRLTAINIGADDFLTKPIRPGHLIELVVGRAKRARALRRQMQGASHDSSSQPLARSALAQRLRQLSDRPAALISVGLDQGEALAARMPALLRCEIEQALAGRIGARIDAGDVYAPWHELHFLVLAARPDHAALQRLAQSFKAGIDVRPVVVGRGQITVRGRVQLVPALDDPERWLDQALAAWTRGDATVRVEASVEASADANASADAGTAAPGALSRQRYQAEYQPLVLLRGGVAGQWAQSLRLRGSPGHASPAARVDLLAAARRAAKPGELDRLSLDLASDTIAVQNRLGRSIRLLLPLAVDSLLDEDFVVRLRAALTNDERGSSELMLELDTGELERQLAAVRPLLETLRRDGLRICLSEFGGQRNALQLLQTVHCDAIKLDSELTLQGNLAFQALIGQIREHGVPLIVEHADNRQSIARLWDLGIDYIQSELIRGYGLDFDYDFEAATV